MGAVGLSEQARAGWRLFRARSPYSQLKALVIVAYAAVVAATLAYVFAPRRGVRNDLGARVIVLAGDPVMGRCFVVENGSRRDWLGVRFEIDGGYQARREAVLAGGKVTLYRQDFTREEPVTLDKKRPRVESTSPPPSMAVTRLRIETRGGVTTRRIDGL